MKTQNIKGFTLGIAMIIMGILITVSLGMSTLLLRDLKQASITESSSRAFNLADGFMNCLVSYEKNTMKTNNGYGDYGGLFANIENDQYNENYIDRTPLQGMATTSYTKNSLTCFGSQILDQSSGDMNKTTITQTDSSDPVSPDYIGGAKTTITIQTNEMKNNMNNTCLVGEIYGSQNANKLFVVHAKTPCIGDRIIERIITRSVQ
ncbi:MAG: hypothetical protein QG614_223 [Patescibacteria group bacterium]|nr:hypothetical protein [Patescibacteria group bacterium]